MKIAIVHEWWTKFGGSENVTMEIAKLFPSADIWVLYKELGFEDNFTRAENFRESWLNHVPGHQNKKLSVALSPLAYRSLLFKKYDLVISSSHNFAHTVKFPRSKNTRYFSYVHSPSRTIWLPEIDSRSKIVNQSATRHLLKGIDTSLGSHVNHLAVNSNEVRNRVSEFWRRDSLVIHPPVDVSFQDFKLEQGSVIQKNSFLLSAGRFVPYKNHDFAIRLAAKLNLEIKVMGGGEDEQRLRNLASDLKADVEFIINPNREKWLETLAMARFLIFPAHEDFGITPIEAMMLGTPVLALAKGGALDYIIDGVNGRFYYGDESSEVLGEFLNETFDEKKIKESVEKFKPIEFRTKFVNWISDSSN